MMTEEPNRLDELFTSVHRRLRTVTILMGVTLVLSFVLFIKVMFFT